MSDRRFFAALLIVFIGLPTLLGIGGCTSNAPAVPDKVTLGIVGTQAALVYIAQDLGLFRKNGIDATIREYEYGLMAVNDLVTGSIDMATATEYVHASKSVRNDDLRILATISAVQDLEIVARRDRGIREARDLKGKKIAATRGTNFEFFLGVFLTDNEIPLKSVQIVDIRPAEMAAAISAGRVDAVSTFPPHSGVVKSSLGTNAVSWPTQGGQSYYFVLDAKESYVKSNGGVIERVLLSLLEAEHYVRQNEAEAKKIIEKRLNLDQATLSSIWPMYRFRVRLDQDLIILMQNESRWMIRNNLSGSREVPDYFRQIHIDGLGKLEPGAVGIIR